MQNSCAYTSALFRRLVSEGREEGLHEGREEGRSALRAGVLAVFDARGVALTADTARSFADATRAVS